MPSAAELYSGTIEKKTSLKKKRIPLLTTYLLVVTHRPRYARAYY